jgi:hypothetical protein
MYCKCITHLLDSPDATEAIRNWTYHKQRPVIAAGINVHCSQIPLEIWQRVRHNTNSVEATHWKSNALGRRLPLLRAIFQYVLHSNILPMHYEYIIWILIAYSSATLDKTDIQRCRLRTESGMTHSYRNTSIQSRFQESFRRERKQFRQIYYKCIVNIFKIC